MSEQWTGGDNTPSTELFSEEFIGQGKVIRVRSTDLYVPVRNDGYVEAIGIVRDGEWKPELASDWRWMKATIQFADLKELE